MKKLAPLVALGLAVGCGGGGGDGGGGGGDSWLRFTPSSIQATVGQGGSATVQLTGTAKSTPTRFIYIGVIVDGTAFSTTTSIAQTGALSYTLTLHTLPSLSPGEHEGYVEVRVCEDDPNTCASPYGGSPWHVPYRITVIPN